jgi:hypothetical protein
VAPQEIEADLRRREDIALTLLREEEEATARKREEAARKAKAKRDRRKARAKKDASPPEPATLGTSDLGDVPGTARDGLGGPVAPVLYSCSNVPILARAHRQLPFPSEGLWSREVRGQAGQRQR